MNALPRVADGTKLTFQFAASDIAHALQHLVSMHARILTILRKRGKRRSGARLPNTWRHRLPLQAMLRSKKHYMQEFLNMWHACISFPAVTASPEPPSCLPHLFLPILHCRISIMTVAEASFSQFLRAQPPFFPSNF